VRETDSGVMKLSDCDPWVPPEPEGGLIIGNKWIPLPPSKVAAPASDAGRAVGTPPKRRIRKR